MADTKPVTSDTFTVTHFQIKYRITKDKQGLVIVACHLIAKTTWREEIVGLPIATGLDLSPDKLMQIFRGEFPGGSVLYQEPSGDALCIRIIINNPLFDAPVQAQILLKEESVPEIEKLKLIIQDLQEDLAETTQQIAQLKEATKLEYLQSCAAVSGTTSGAAVLQTGTDYNNTFHTTSDANTFQTLVLSEVCYVTAVKLRCWDKDGRTYTMQWELSQDGQIWKPFLQDLQVCGVGAIKIEQPVKGIRIKGGCPAEAQLHFTMFKLI